MWFVQADANDLAVGQSSGLWEATGNPDPNEGGDFEFLWYDKNGVVEMVPSSGPVSSIKAGSTAGYALPEVMYRCWNCYNPCFFTCEHLIAVVEVVDVHPNNVVTAIGTEPSFVAITNPPGYFDAPFVSMTATNCTVLSTLRGTITITRTTGGIATVTAHAGTSSASRPVKFVELDHAPDANFALSVANATQSMLDPATWVACWEDSNDAWVEITANLIPGCSDEEAQRVLGWNVPPRDPNIYPNDPWTKRYISCKYPTHKTVTASCGFDPNGHAISATLNIIVAKVNGISVSDRIDGSLERINPPDANDLYIPAWLYSSGGLTMNCGQVSAQVSFSPPSAVDYIVLGGQGEMIWPVSEFPFDITQPIDLNLLPSQGNHSFTLRGAIDLDGGGDPNADDCPDSPDVKVKVVELKSLNVDGQENPATVTVCYTDEPNSYVEITAVLDADPPNHEVPKLLHWSGAGGGPDPDNPRKWRVSRNSPGRTTVTATCGSQHISVTILVLKFNSLTVTDHNNPGLTRTNPPDANDLYIPETADANAAIDVSVGVEPYEEANQVMITVSGLTAEPNKGPPGTTFVLTPTDTNRSYTVSASLDPNGGGPSCGSASITVHVVGVQQVEWIGVDPGDGQTNLSADNGTWHGGGWRIFPEQNTPSGPTHNQVKVRAMLTHTIPAGLTPPFRVYFKVCDMDDPTYNHPSEHSDPGDGPEYFAGDDNRGRPGEIVGGNEAEVVGQAHGEVVYTIPQEKAYPGNNFRVTAHAAQAYLDSVQIDTGSGTRGLDLKRSNGSTVPERFKTPLLSLWRRLWIEGDSMGPVPIDPTDPERNFVMGTAASCTYDPNKNTTTIDLGQKLPSQFAYVNQFESGTFVVTGGGTYNVLSNSANFLSNDTVTVGGCVTGTPSYRLYDDDDQYLLSAPVHCILGDYASAFLEAYIEPSYLDETYSDVVPFDLNVSSDSEKLNGPWKSGRDVTSSLSFWCHLVVACYQPEYSHDGDPVLGEYRDEYLVPGETLIPSPGNETMMFLETQRDGDEVEGRVLAHEIGHTGGGEHSHGGLMASIPEGNRFTEITISRMRSKNVWSR